MYVAEGSSPSLTGGGQEPCGREAAISKTILLVFRENVETSIQDSTNKGRRWSSKHHKK
jgi:hypothetical protein